MEKKKFEIHKPAPKKFEIIPQTSQQGDVSKKFQIIPTQEWFRQANSHDCGPCLILNALRRIPGVRHIPQSIEEVRRDVNRLRSEDPSLAALAPTGWFTSRDVSEYLEKIAGLNVREFTCFADEAEEISQNIHRELESTPPAMIYNTLGRHFRGFIPTPAGYEVLDSFSGGPERVEAARVNEMISESINQSTSPANSQRIGIVR